MIIDFHAHFGMRPGTSAELAAEGRRLGVDAFCTSMVSSYIPGPDEVARMNEITYEVSTADPGYLLPFTYVNPMHGATAIAMLEDGLRRGMKGIKLWVSVWADDPCVNDIAEWAIAHDMTIMHHSWMKWNGNIPSESQAHQIARLGERFPDLKLVMAHVGGDWEYGVKSVRHCPNVGVDTSGSYLHMGYVEMCVRELGEDRVYFGSDVSGADLVSTLAKITGARITEQAREKILGLNAARLLGLG